MGSASYQMKKKNILPSILIFGWKFFNYNVSSTLLSTLIMICSFHEIVNQHALIFSGLTIVEIRAIF